MTEPDRQVIYRVRGLTKSYRIGKVVIPVLNGMDLEVASGEILIVAGRSGAGKSTLVHILGLLDAPDAGELRLDGIDLSRQSRRRLDRIRNRTFGFVFQFYHLLAEFDAVENVMLPSMIDVGPLGWWKVRRKRRARAVEILEQVGLGHRLSHRPYQLSGGERQRVALARALMNEPRIVFCDEPTGNLDEGNSLQIQKLLWQLNAERGQTLVIVTHDPSIAARGHRIVRMLDGRVIAEELRRAVGEPLPEWPESVDGAPQSQALASP